MKSKKYKIDGRVKTTKIELPTGGYIRVEKDGKFYSVKTFNFGVYVSNLNDVLKEEAEVRVQELLDMSNKLAEV
jgi:hypothetical protein